MMIEKGASLSPCRRYRYTLTRVWDRSAPSVVFCGLNPSTADETEDDPTIRREVSFAQDWGFGSLIKVNAYAFRSTDPRGLWKTGDPVGLGNEAAILAAAREAVLFVAAWGANIMPGRQDSLLFGLRGSGIRVHALKLTKGGFPAHPLYLPKTLKPRLWVNGELR